MRVSDFYVTPLSGYVSATQFSLQRLGDLLTMRSYVFNATVDPWITFQATYDRAKGLLNYDPVYQAYIQQALQLAGLLHSSVAFSLMIMHVVADNVQYLEIRVGFGKRYDLVGVSTKPG